MKYSEFPIEIKQLVEKRTLEQNHIYDEDDFNKLINVCDKDRGFSWTRTLEGHNFWDKVLTEEDFDRFWAKYPKETKTAIDSSNPSLLKETFKEGDVVKCVKNTFSRNRECIGKLFKLSASEAESLNKGFTAVLNSYPSGERNEFGINFEAEFLVVATRTESESISHYKISRYDIQRAFAINPRTGGCQQGNIYSKQNRTKIRCGY